MPLAMEDYDLLVPRNQLLKLAENSFSFGHSKRLT